MITAIVCDCPFMAGIYHWQFYIGEQKLLSNTDIIGHLLRKAKDHAMHGRCSSLG